MTKIKAWADENLQGDRVIWAVVFSLALISILVVYSSIGTLAYKRMVSPESYLLKHTFMIVLAFTAMWTAHKIDYRFYSKLSRIGLWLSVPLLIFTFTNGTTLNDASRWITVPFINATFQPSDFASLVLIINVASMLSKRQQNIESLQEALIPILTWVGVICGLIALTNFSSAIMLLITCILIMFIGRVPVKYIFTLVMIGLLAGAVAFKVGVRGETAKNRVIDFIEGKELPFQAKHARIAVATGGITVKGPGQSDQRNILPHPYSDFVYAIVIEEYGIIGGVIVLVLYL
ncbi:MAG TPA: FtsW/RodA/SpoVE family cell cycle protein, partial [Cyclobacteriaceae bacterium]|nr:FtsW/RodA/SpoVE family cell cycle protein [Cyclobacteriaceae bacterium]